MVQKSNKLRKIIGVAIYFLIKVRKIDNAFISNQIIEREYVFAINFHDSKIC